MTKKTSIALIDQTFAIILLFVFDPTPPKIVQLSIAYNVSYLGGPSLIQIFQVNELKVYLHMTRPCMKITKTRLFLHYIL